MFNCLCIFVTIVLYFKTCNYYKRFTYFYYLHTSNISKTVQPIKAIFYVKPCCTIYGYLRIELIRSCIRRKLQRSCIRTNKATLSDSSYYRSMLCFSTNIALKCSIGLQKRLTVTNLMISRSVGLSVGPEYG